MEVITLAEVQLFKGIRQCLTATYPLDSYGSSKGVLSFSHTDSQFLPNFC